MNTGSAHAVFTIILSQAVTEPVQVEWFTSDGTAKAGVDYAANKGAVVFAPGETSKTVDILVYGRAVGTEDRSFFVEMLPPTNAILGQSIGECIIHVDTTGSTPVTEIIVPTGPRGLTGKSAYQSYVDTTTDNPPMTESEWVESLKGDPEEIAQEVAPLIDVGNTVLTAEGTEAFSKPDQTTVKALARRIAFAAPAKIATVVLADGDNYLTQADLTGDTLDMFSAGLYPRIVRGTTIISPEWNVEVDGRLLIKGAVAGDVLYAEQYDLVSTQAVVNQSKSQVREALRRSYAEAGINLVDGSFGEGGTVATSSDALLFERDGKGYSWGGALPKTVPENSTPDSTGGVAAGAWVKKDLNTLRGQLASDAGDDMLGIGPGRTQADKNKETVSTADFGKALPTMAQINGVIGSNVFSRLSLAGFHTSGDKGGGIFYWDPSRPKTAHDGGIIIDPDIVFPSDWSNSTQVNAWFTPAASGIGCWIRQIETGYYMAEWFGAQPWVIGGSQDSKIAFNQCAKIAGEGGSWRFTGRHRITGPVEIPQRQTFGSFGNCPSVSSAIFDPANFQGANTATGANADKITNAVFFDAIIGEAFRCHEGVTAKDFTVYGNSIQARGVNVGDSLPTGHHPISAFKHRKFMIAQNVTVVLFSWAFDSSSWYSTDPGQGNYYTMISKCDAIYCKYALKTAGVIPFNTKCYGLRAYCNAIDDVSVARRDTVFFGGSFEGMNLATVVRASGSLSFIGTYMETNDASFNGTLLNIVGGCKVSFQSCLIYLNNIARLVYTGGSGQGAAISYLNVNSNDNEFVLSVPNATCSIYECSTAPTKQCDLSGDLLRKASGTTVAYWAGAVPAESTVKQPLTIPF